MRTSLLWFMVLQMDTLKHGGRIGTGFTFCRSADCGFIELFSHIHNLYLLSFFK